MKSGEEPCVLTKCMGLSFQCLPESAHCRGGPVQPGGYDDSAMIEMSGYLTSATSEHARWICELRGHGGKDESHAWPNSMGSLSLKRIEVLLLLSVQPLREKLTGALNVVPPLEESA